MRKNDEQVMISRRRRILFFIHVVFYTMFWVIAFIAGVASNAYWSLIGSPPFAMLLWTPLFILHLVSYIGASAQASTVTDDRAAYREGFRDAVQMLRDQDGRGGALVERLVLDDEGELVPLVAGKRKRE